MKNKEFLILGGVLLTGVLLLKKNTKTNANNEDVIIDDENIASVGAADCWSKTKEFYDVMSQFEKDLPKMPIYVGAKIERDKSGVKGYFYTSGKINDLFHAYMAGYQSGKFIYRE